MKCCLLSMRMFSRPIVLLETTKITQATGQNVHMLAMYSYSLGTSNPWLKTKKRKKKKQEAFREPQTPQRL